MKKLLFVDHSYHAKTLATKFLQDLLAQRFAVDILWDDSWSTGQDLSPARLNQGGHDAIVFFQTLPHPRALRRLRCRNLTWVPMRDGLRYGASRHERLRIGGLKVLNFCREAQDYFIARGQLAHGVQYWPEPAAPPARPRRERPVLFFWPRRREIGWPLLKALLGEFRPERIVLRYAADPGHELPLPSDEEIREYRIEVLRGWLEHDDYLRKLTDCDIFVAPRPLEGIGQSVLEAMRYGMSVIAADGPTMNEYVQHGSSGWLYKLDGPQPLDFANWAARGPAAQAAVAQGRARWLQQGEGLIDFVAADPPQARWDWRLKRLAGV